jgi:hypothetical protein
LADEDLSGLSRRLVEVTVLRREMLATVTEEPARLAGIKVDRELVDRLVAETDTGKALPLLAFTLQQLADEAMSAALARTGRSRSEVIAGLLRLVTVDEHAQPTRWRVARDDLP